ncbi:uncharacterized protein LOC114415034 [Glycine soja]|uniref:uncharacterized protein n=1 Tax=Glycine max TaxID=3847 RepID=UPI0003DEBA6D|nr:uncharacterized protein LOC102663831 [Glycine max]XP_028235377.1 uncharacterized protein LOC114415034 [Glycine soja]|eukprot:XP_006574064.1 uncharacterized protein LOC102663831 [Glycine max]
MTLFGEEVEDEDRDKWIVWFDDVSNELGHGVRVVLVSPDEQYIPFTTRLGFDYMNNIVEYEVCALGIQAAINFKVKLLKAYIRKLIEFFDDISFHHIPREENQMVDALATLTSMFQLSPHRDLMNIEFRCCGKLAHCCLIEEEKNAKPWYFNIKRYIEDKKYPHEASNNDKRTLQREAEQMLVEVHEGSFGTHANGELGITSSLWRAIVASL